MSNEIIKNKTYRLIKDICITLAAIATIAGLILTILSEKHEQNTTDLVKKEESVYTRDFITVSRDTLFQISEEKYVYFKRDNFIITRKKTEYNFLIPYKTNDTIINIPFKKVKKIRIGKQQNVLTVCFNSNINDISIVCDDKLKRGDFIVYLEEVAKIENSFSFETYSWSAKMIIGFIIQIIGSLMFLFSLFMILSDENNGCAILILSTFITLIGLIIYLPYVDY